MVAVLLSFSANVFTSDEYCKAEVDLIERYVENYKSAIEDYNASSKREAIEDFNAVLKTRARLPWGLQWIAEYIAVNNNKKQC